MANFLQKLFGSANSLPEGLQLARQRAEQQGDTEAVQAIDNGTYKELLEKRAEEREPVATSGYDTYSYSIAGINYRKGIAAYVGRTEGYLKAEPSNKYDPNAIAVYAQNGHHLGYIPANETYEVHNLHLHFPIPVAISIEEHYDYDESRTFYIGYAVFNIKQKNGNKSVTF